MSSDAMPVGAKSGWKLTSAAFDRLLAVLDADRERAAEAYEGLRRRVIGLVQWWGAADPEALADRIFDRVARKLEEGVVIEGSLGAYVRGVARMVYYESNREPRPDATRHEPVAPPTRTESDAPLACLDRCLATLVDADRALVLKYYEDGKKEAVRRRLADELGLSPNALRLRTHRLRERLERCVTACLAQR